jgi:ABC-type lipoprotein release transport system permease subunit
MASSYSVVLRTLRVRRTTLALAASVPAMTAINGVMLLETTGDSAMLLIAVLVFSFTLIASLAVFSDLVTGSSRGISTLNSLGAGRSSILSAMLLGMLAFGLLGSGLGAGLGLLLGSSLSNAALAAGPAMAVTYVLIASAAGTTVGVLVGARVSWKK